MADADEQTLEEIKQLAHEWLDAARRRDRETLDRILADDFLISGWQPEGRLADKQFYIDDCMTPVDIQDGSSTSTAGRSAPMARPPWSIASSIFTPW